MPYQTAKIKDLSIAMEALSRINGSDQYFEAVANLLQEAIEEAVKENHPLKPVDTSDNIPF